MEAETSSMSADGKLLYQHFCNCLFLGQWELAKASVLLLKKYDPDKSIYKILHDVALKPFNMR